MTGTDSNANLKPCPLCGRSVDLLYDNQEGYWIECECGISFLSDNEYDKKEFIQYAKDEFGIIITPVRSDNPDTFEKIFGFVIPST